MGLQKLQTADLYWISRKSSPMTRFLYESTKFTSSVRCAEIEPSKCLLWNYVVTTHFCNIKFKVLLLPKDPSVFSTGKSVCDSGNSGSLLGAGMKYTRELWHEVQVTEKRFLKISIVQKQIAQHNRTQHNTQKRKLGHVKYITFTSIYVSKLHDTI